MNILDLKCTQCGASDFDIEPPGLFRCTYCKSLFSINLGKRKGIIIKKGAKVKFGENVVIKGNVYIDDGAEVEFNGKIKLIQKGSDDEIQEAKLKLENEK